MKETIEFGGVTFILDRAEGTIEIVDFRSLVFTPATLAYVLQQYGTFTVPVRFDSSWGMIEGTTDAG